MRERDEQAVGQAVQALGRPDAPGSRFADVMLAAFTLSLVSTLLLAIFLNVLGAFEAALGPTGTPAGWPPLVLGIYGVSALVAVLVLFPLTVPAVLYFGLPAALVAFVWEGSWQVGAAIAGTAPPTGAVAGVVMIALALVFGIMPAMLWWHIVSGGGAAEARGFWRGVRRALLGHLLAEGNPAGASAEPYPPFLDLPGSIIWTVAWAIAMALAGLALHPDLVLFPTPREWLAMWTGDRRAGPLEGLGAYPYAIVLGLLALRFPRWAWGYWRHRALRS